MDVFCTDAIMEQVYYESDHMLVVYNKYPALPGHSLVIPKRHVETFMELSDTESFDVTKTMRKIMPVLTRIYGSEGSYDMVVQNGPYSGMSINHLHIHLIPRKKDDSYQVDTSQLYEAISERKADMSIHVSHEVQRLREEFGYSPKSKRGK